MNSGFNQLFVGKLTVRVACRMQYACASVSHMCHNRDEFKMIHESYGYIASTFESE